MRTSPCLFALATLAAAACHRDKQAPPAEGSAAASVAGGSVAGGSVAGGSVAGGSAAGGSAAAAAAVPGGIELFVNDQPIGSVQPSLVASWPRLDSLVPGDARKLGTWEHVTLQAAGAAAPVEIDHPSSTYAQLLPVVFPGDGGAPAFGMFDPVELARKGKPAMRQDHLAAIRIKVSQGGSRGQNDDGGGAASDPTKLVVTIKTPAGVSTLTGDKLLALPREDMPGNPDQKGWRLTALLAAAGVTTYQHLILSDAAGANLTLDKKDVSDTSVPFIKLNKQGQLRLRVLKKAGDGWNPEGDLRALVAIEAR
jgi:hypothetical protein